MVKTVIEAVVGAVNKCYSEKERLPFKKRLLNWRIIKD